MRDGRRPSKSRGVRLLDVRWLDTTVGHARVGIVVPRYGHTAVQRNTLKRRLRELARLHILPAPCSCDVLLRARPDAYDVGYDQLRAAVGQIRDGVIATAPVA